MKKTRKLLIIAFLITACPVLAISQTPVIKWDGVSRYIKDSIEMQTEHRNFFSSFYSDNKDVSNLEITFRYDGTNGAQLGISIRTNSLGAIHDYNGEKVWNPGHCVGSAIDAIAALGRYTYFHSDREVADFIAEALHNVYIGMTPSYDTSYVVAMPASVNNYPMIDFSGNIDFVHESPTRARGAKKAKKTHFDYSTINATFQYAVGFILPRLTDFGGQTNAALLQFINLVQRHK